MSMRHASRLPERCWVLLAGVIRTLSVRVGRTSAMWAARRRGGHDCRDEQAEARRRTGDASRSARREPQFPLLLSLDQAERMCRALCSNKYEPANASPNETAPVTMCSL